MAAALLIATTLYRPAAMQSGSADPRDEIDMIPPVRSLR
jgi:hypothetical protein